MPPMLFPPPLAVNSWQKAYHQTHLIQSKVPVYCFHDIKIATHKFYVLYTYLPTLLRNVQI